MSEWNGDGREQQAASAAVRRVPGKYIVFGMIAFGAVFLGFMMLLALKLDPAAERFHKGVAPTKQR